MKKNNLNLNPLKFVLLFAVLVFFASCGKEEIEKASDTNTEILMLSESTQVDQHQKKPNEFYTQENFTEIKFSNFQHNVFKQESNYTQEDITLNGALDVSHVFAPKGELSIHSDALNLDAKIRIEEGKVFYDDGEHKFWLDPTNLKELNGENGVVHNYFEVAEEMIKAMQTGDQMEAKHKMALSMLALGTTDQFLMARDQSKSQIGFRNYDCNWYDHFIAGLIAAPIAVAAAAGCASLTAGCTVGGVLTFGGIAVPCAVLVPGCAAGAFFSVAGAYNYVLHNWLCDPITCTFTIPALCWSGNPFNNSVQLNWSQVSGAQRYQVVQWVNGAWFPLAETTNTSITISGMSPGYVYYFGAKTICNNTATAGARWTTVFN